MKKERTKALKPNVHTDTWIQSPTELESSDQHKKNCNLYVVALEPEGMQEKKGIIHIAYGISVDR